MNISNGLIDKWCEEAASDLDIKGWREIETNSLLLIIYSCQKSDVQQLYRKVARPFWWFVGIISPGIAWYIISGLLNL